jgi:class 3 adenylate cyclase
LLSRKKGVAVVVVSLDEILAVAQDAFNQAAEAADTISLSKFSECVENARAKSARLGARMLAHEPGVEGLRDFWGLKAWAVLLSFDLRDSSKLAQAMSPRNMYVIIHTYLRTMLKIIENSKGIVVGLRGDGAIASFGWVEIGDGKPAVTDAQAGKTVRRACDCGDAMVQAMQKAVNPVLDRGGIKIKINVAKQLLIGVGIDVGEIVATRIGLGEAHEYTAYGNAVNQCCKKNYGNNQVILTRRAKILFPTSAGGRIQFRRHPTKEDAFTLRYPESYRTLE